MEKQDFYTGRDWNVFGRVEEKCFAMNGLPTVWEEIDDLMRGLLRMETEITLIIPMYNGRKYIKQAIDSVLDQTFCNFEIILIDDCSTDGSYEFAKEIYGKEKRIRIIRNKRNIGPGLTRNRGMYLSRSKYVAFMDGDDIILPDFFEKLLDVAEAYQADVVSSMGFYHSETEEISFDMTVSPDLDSNYQEEIYIAPDEVKARMDGWLRREYSIACYNKLYRREFLILDDIKFHDHYADDWGFVFQCLMRAKKYIKTPYIGNIYRNIQGSVSRPIGNTDMKQLEKKIVGLECVMDEFLGTMKREIFFEEHPEYREMILVQMVTILNNHFILRYYPDMHEVSSDVYQTTLKALEKIFGDKAQLAEIFFTGYQLQLRQIMNLQESRK